MKRSEFVNLYADLIAAGRKRNYPDLRPSEAAMSRMDDEKKALSVWKEHREFFAPLPPDVVKRMLDSEQSQAIH